MSKINDGGPAFPMPIAGCNDGSVYNTLEQSSGELGGMSMRDYFAAKAMQGFNANSHDQMVSWSFETVADYSYKQADAMLRARENTT